MGKIPDFVGKNTLSLTDLQALADAVPRERGGVVPMEHRGRTQWGPAQYGRDDGVPDVCGVVGGVVWGDSSVNAPRIVDGVIELPVGEGGLCPLAEYDPEWPGYAVAGRVGAVSWGSSINAPRIDGGHLKLPSAHAEGDVPGEGWKRMGGIEWLGWDPLEFEDSAVLLGSSVMKTRPRLVEGHAYLPPGVLGVVGSDGVRYALRECREGVDVAVLPGGGSGGDVTSGGGVLRLRWQDGFLAFEFV